MNIKNPKLTHQLGKKKNNDLPGMYKESKLFSRKHPSQEGSQYSKGVDIPDPQLATLEPEEDDKCNPTRKAINMLNSLLEKANFSSSRNTMPSEKQAKREYSHSFARYPKGISGVTTPDLPERGKDWKEGKEEDAEEAQKEAQSYFKEPENLLAQKAVIKSLIDCSQKALAGAPRFAQGPLVPPREKQFLTQHGFSPEEIDSGQVQMSPRLRGEFNRWLTGTVRKSIRHLDS